MTMVTVTRDQRSFTRSEVDEVDEAEVFEGSQNRLTMNQTYTLEFQCEYKLRRYPFDTQVIKDKANNFSTILRSARLKWLWKA